MFLAIALNFIATTALAAPHTLADRLSQILPEGYSEGTTPKGAPCRVVFSYARGANNAPNYAKAQVIAEPEGNLVEVEIFFEKTKVSGRWSRELAFLQSQKDRLQVARQNGDILVKAQKRETPNLSAECRIAGPKSFLLQRNR